MNSSSLPIIYSGRYCTPSFVLTLISCAFLSPHKHLSHDEAVRAIRSIHNPVLASKKLVDIAQSYGAKENLAVLIVRFNFQKKIHHQSNHNYQQHRLSREHTYSADTSSGEHSQMASPLLPVFDSTGYLSVGELSDGDEDDSNEDQQVSSEPRHLTSDYFYHPYDHLSSSSETPATFNGSAQNHVLSRADRSRFLAASLNDTSVIGNRMGEKTFQSDTGIFNFPASNAQPVRTVPSELTIVSEILSPLPSRTMLRTKRMKNPSLSGDRYWTLIFGVAEPSPLSLLVHHRPELAVFERN